MKSSARASQGNRKHTLHETDSDTDSHTTNPRTAARDSGKTKSKDAPRNSTKTKKSTLAEKEPKPKPDAGSSSRKRSKQAESTDDDDNDKHDDHPDMEVDKVSEKAKRALYSAQQLQDELEEAEDAKERLQNKVAQLEERAQFLEASSRLNASIVAKENMDLKERARQLQIQLSEALYERDNLRQGTIFQGEGSESENKDEAIQLSVQLKEAWLSITKLKTDKEALNKELSKSQETCTSLTTDLTNVRDQLKTSKSEMTREKGRWNADRESLEAEIKSLKGKGGGAENAEWTKIRKRVQDERAAWDQERKIFMDQIASLKVKAGSLGLQSKAPPEWIKDKQRLMDQCSTLQARLATHESDRATGSSGSNNATIKKLEAENQKLEKKFEDTRAKLKQAMDAFRAFQAQAEEEKAKPKRKPRATRQPASKSRAKHASGSESESEVEQEIAPVAMKRTTRTAAVAAVRKIGHLVESESDQESDVSESEDGHDGGETGDADKAHEDKDDEEGLAADENEMEEDSDDYIPKSKGKQKQSKKSSKGDDSASDFEMTEQIVESKERKGTEKPGNPIKQSIAKKDDKKNDKHTKESATMPEDASGPSSTPNPPPSAVSESTGTSLPSTSPNAAAQEQAPAPAEKAKKKRKLLTGKGLQDLSDILHGPGSSLGSESSSGLEFSRHRFNKKSPATTSTPLSTTTKPAQALDALNAIKMQFSIKPKPVTTTTGRKEI
ncbi:hypothetical protein EMPS_06711 [Entomortierella parvispora]|uniref:Uncharacterized protein n=1 Tax=Entomortierella parvispora TaxID=205924 RepID=A0A9P3HD88_9FUNG|nr:hypothetical protein EMPS_06711 [Entomortierella parvispora]